MSLLNQSCATGDLQRLIPVSVNHQSCAMSSLSNRVVRLLKGVPAYAVELAVLPIEEQRRLLAQDQNMLAKTACFKLLSRRIEVAQKVLDICTCDKVGPTPPELGPPRHLLATPFPGTATAAPTSSPSTETAAPTSSLRAVPPPTVPVKRRRVSEYDLKNPVSRCVMRSVSRRRFSARR